MKTCAFRSMLFKNTEELNLVLKSCISYIYVPIPGKHIIKLNMFFQFNKLLIYWHVDLPRC